MIDSLSIAVSMSFSVVHTFPQAIRSKDNVMASLEFEHARSDSEV